MRQLVIHGHFYQPPREDPWLELVPRERSASPDHDWNARITRQCYEPLARAQVLDAQGQLVRLINAYAWCSFDIGPTLFRWMDDHAPHVVRAIVAGDRESRARTGFGNAVAMPYHHVILPLISRRDKISEIRWGVRDFRRRFLRDPEGLWLPETAIDDETLDVLAEESIRFTIVGPSQVDHQPADGVGVWRGASGREVSICVYDGSAAHHVAFGGALDNVCAWEASLVDPHDGREVISLATDGETFGHHHPLGDRALATLIDRISHGNVAQLTNYAAVLAQHPSQESVRVVSPSSWSCVHGVGRWQRECGCRFEPNTSQAWRAPLYHGLADLSAAVHQVAEQQWPAHSGDIWSRSREAGPWLEGSDDLSTDARRLLEALQHTLAMFTSCAWFFDDIGRLEPQIVMRHAARAIELLPGDVGRALEAQLVAVLALAHSNDPSKGSGADIWHRDLVLGDQRRAALAAALAAARALAPHLQDEIMMPPYRWTTSDDVVELEHTRTGERTRWECDPEVLGVVSHHVRVRSVDTGATFLIGIAHFPAPFCAVMRDVATEITLEATLSAPDKAALAIAAITPERAGDLAFAGALNLVARDGLDAAGIVLHAALDMFELDQREISDAQRADAFELLATMPASPARERLATRLGIAP